MDHNIDEGTIFKKMQGFFKIWAVDPVSGQRHLLIDKKNMILNEGADLLAAALAGVKYSNISHIYIGYKNHADGTFDKPVIDKEYSVKFTSYNSGEYADFGYLRLPLAYSPSFINQDGYQSNITVFTAVVATGDTANGAVFRPEDYGGAQPSQIFEVALVAATDPSGQAQDKVFSRAQFEPLLYNPSYNLTITWGVQFLA
jgi:hypothetical protein